MQAFVSKRWLLARMYEPDVVIVDCRFQLGEPEAGREAFRKGHIPGAVYLDPAQELMAPGLQNEQPDTDRERLDSELERGYSLPNAEELATRLGRVGIGAESRVIAYDQGGAMAAWLWWLLRYLGHAQVYVLEESFSAWKRAGYPVSDKPKIAIPAPFAVRPRQDMLVDASELQSLSGRPDVIPVDLRDVQGLGHDAGLPGGWTFGLAQSSAGSAGNHSAVRSVEPFTSRSRDDTFIVYGETAAEAARAILALTEAGFRNVRMLVGERILRNNKGGCAHRRAEV
jgi:thiosulfate/3-mercaptopyruvate sulfurtransferase